MHHLKQQSFFYVHTKKQHTEASEAVWNVVVVASHIQMIRNGWNSIVTVFVDGF